MNCRRVQKLIPLHVESDLPSGLATRVASHLEDCGRCNWLADEYKESQGWLRSYTPPELDEQTLGDLRHGVMSRIADLNARPSRWTSLAQHWSRRPVVALSAGLLIVFGMVVLYIYQARAKVELKATATQVKQTESGGREEGPPSGVTAMAPGATLTEHATLGRTQSQTLKRRDRTRRMALNEFAHLVPPRGIDESATAPTGETRAFTNDANGSRDMLRIEFQTGDPNIRIIWFAPKETDSHQNKPATD